MKILVLSFYFSPDLSAGSFRSTALVEALLASGEHDVHVVTTMPNRYHTFSATAPGSESAGRLRVSRVALPSHQNGLLDQVKCFRCYAKAAMEHAVDGDYDAVYATSSRLMTAWLGARISRKLSIPLYLDIRDIFADTVKDVFSGWKGKLLFPVLSVIERWTLRRANAINIVSEGFREYFESRYGSLPLRVFTNGIDEEFMGESFASSQTGDASDDGPTRILYAGNIGEGQGLHQIIPGLAKALGRRVHIHVVGGGGRQLQLEQAVEGLENVSLHPPVQRQELIDMYRQADVLFLHLNDYDAFLKVLPSKLFEYAASGKPILAGVAGYAADFARAQIENVGVFSPCDVSEAVAAFDSLDLSHTPRDAFVQKFSRRNIMAEMASDVVTVFASAGES